MSEIKVNSIKGVGASTAAITVNNTDGTCTANITNKPNRNLIINGAMQVAQRGTSSTSGGYQTVDRFPSYHTGGAVTQSQGSLTSGSPFEKGFTKYLRITNTTANTGTDGARSIIPKLEAQDIANSGWNYKSSSSYITLSFWVRSSVNQEFYILAQTQDGTKQAYPFSIGTLSENTWTKVTHSIPGNSNITMDNNTENGLQFFIYAFLGTDFTSSSVSLNAWGAYSSSARTPDYTNTWAATTNATFDITGLQLEVGSVATDFEHRSFAQELLLCQRYYAVAGVITADGTPERYHNNISLPVDMRTSPTRSVGAIETGSGATMAPNYEQGLANSKRHFYQGSANSAISGAWFIFEAEL